MRHLTLGDRVAQLWPPLVQRHAALLHAKKCSIDIQITAYAEPSIGRAEAPDSSEGLKGPDTGDRVAQALKASFKDLDSQILSEEENQGVEKGAFGGCTACLAFVMGDVSPLLYLTFQQQLDFHLLSWFEVPCCRSACMAALIC